MQKQAEIVPLSKLIPGSEMIDKSIALNHKHKMINSLNMSSPFVVSDF